MVVVIWVYSIMGLTGYQLNSQTVTIGALTLGLGVMCSYNHTFGGRGTCSYKGTWGNNKICCNNGRATSAALTTAGGFQFSIFLRCSIAIIWTGFVVAILALVSSIFVLPALYTPFLKGGCEKILSEKNSISESE